MIWQEVTVGEFLKNREERFKPYDKKIKGLRRIDKIDFSGQLFLSNKPSNTDMILVRRNDLVISGINVEKGAMCIYDDKEDISATIHYSSYEIDRKKINVDFLKLFLISPEFKNAIKEQVPGGIKTEIKPKHLLPLKIVIPKTLEEQEDIVNKFNSVKVKVLEASSEFGIQIEYITKLRQQILQDAIQGKLVQQNPNDEPASVLLEKIKAEKEKLIKEKKLKKSKPLPPIKKEEIPFNIPHSWVWCRLGELTSVTKLAGFEYTKYIKLQKVGEVPVIRAQNVKPNRILDDNLLFIDEKISMLLERSALTRRCLLITFIGAGIGEVAIFNKKERWHLAPNVAKAEPILNEISLEYLMWFLLSEYGQKEFFKIQKATAQPSLSMGTIRIVCIPLPPFSEQQRIVKKVEELLTVCDELEKKVKQNQYLTQQLLQSALKEALEQKGN